jgi:hypothetical protein
VTTDVVGASDSVDGFSQGTTHQEAKTGEYVYDGSDWYLRNSVDVRDGAIPDSGLLHRYTVDESATTSGVEDLEADLDLSGSISSITSDAFDGFDAAVFNASNSDNMTASKSTGVSPPYDMYMVGRLTTNDTSAFQALHDFTDTNASSDNLKLNEDGSNPTEWELFDGSTSAKGGSPDTNYHLFQIESRDATNTRLLIDDTVIIDNGNLDPSDFDGIVIGQRYDGSQHANMEFTETYYYDADDSNYSKSNTVNFFQGRYPSLSL